MLSGMQAAVGAIIASITYDMAINVVKEKQFILIIIMIISFVLTYFYNLNVVYVIIGCGLLGLMQSLFRYWRKK